MSPVEIQKEIEKLGGLKEIYKPIKEVDRLLGKKKSQILRYEVDTALTHYNANDPRIIELDKKLKEINLTDNTDYQTYLKLRREVLDERKNYINNCANPYYKFKEGYIIYISPDYYSKSHSTNYSPILLEALFEIDKIFPYDNWDKYPVDEKIEFYKKIIEVLLKFDCIEKAEC